MDNMDNMDNMNSTASGVSTRVQTKTKTNGSTPSLPTEDWRCPNCNLEIKFLQVHMSWSFCKDGHRSYMYLNCSECGWFVSIGLSQLKLVRTDK